jgi:hypothetical protein
MAKSGSSSPFEVRPGHAHVVPVVVPPVRRADGESVGGVGEGQAPLAHAVVDRDHQLRAVVVVEVVEPGHEHVPVPDLGRRVLLAVELLGEGVARVGEGPVAVVPPQPGRAGVGDVVGAHVVDERLLAVRPDEQVEIAVRVDVAPRRGLGPGRLAAEAALRGDVDEPAVPVVAQQHAGLLPPRDEQVEVAVAVVVRVGDRGGAVERSPGRDVHLVERGVASAPGHARFPRSLTGEEHVEVPVAVVVLDADPGAHQPRGARVLDRHGRHRLERRRARGGARQRARRAHLHR